MGNLQVFVRTREVGICERNMKLNPSSTRLFFRTSATHWVNLTLNFFRANNFLTTETFYLKKFRGVICRMSK